MCSISICSICIFSISICSTGVSPIKGYRQVKRRESSKFHKAAQRRFGPIDDINELRGYGQTIEMPRSVAEMTALKMYSVPVNYELYPATEGILFISKKQVVTNAQTHMHTWKCTHAQHTCTNAHAHADMNMHTGTCTSVYRNNNGKTARLVTSGVHRLPGWSKLWVFMLKWVTPSPFTWTGHTSCTMAGSTSNGHKTQARLERITTSPSLRLHQWITISGSPSMDLHQWILSSVMDLHQWISISGSPSVDLH